MSLLLWRVLLQTFQFKWKCHTFYIPFLLNSGHFVPCFACMCIHVHDNQRAYSMHLMILLLIHESYSHNKNLLGFKVPQYSLFHFLLLLVKLSGKGSWKEVATRPQPTEQGTFFLLMLLLQYSIGFGIMLTPPFLFWMQRFLDHFEL